MRYSALAIQQSYRPEVGGMMKNGVVENRLTLERIHADGGPGFEALIERAGEFVQRAETEVGQGFFIGGDLVIIQLEASPGATGISGSHSSLTRWVTPRLEWKQRTPLSSRVRRVTL